MAGVHALGLISLERKPMPDVLKKEGVIDSREKSWDVTTRKHNPMGMC
jgi:hypothetical protein